MIRFLFVFVLFFYSGLSAAACVSGDTWTGTLALPINTSPASVIINGDSYTVATATPGDISTDGQYQQYTGTWSCDPSVPPPKCYDGTDAPNGDVTQCSIVQYCPDGSVAPYGQISQCPVEVHCPDGTLAPFNQMALCSNPYEANSTLAALGAIESGIANTNLSLSLMGDVLKDTRSIATFTLAAITNGFTWTMSKIELAGLSVSHAVDSLQGNLIQKLGQMHLTLENLFVEMQDTRYAVQNLPYNIMGQFDTFLRDRTVEIQQSIANLDGTIWNGIQALTGGGQTTVDGSDPYSPQILASIDNMALQLSDFISGTPSALSDLGTSTLAASTGENPLGTPEEINLSGIIKTNVSGSAGCPSAATADVMGHTITFSYQPMCDWAAIVGKLIMIIAAIVSIRIIASGGF